MEREVERVRGVNGELVLRHRDGHHEIIANGVVPHGHPRRALGTVAGRGGRGADAGARAAAAGRARGGVLAGRGAGRAACAGGARRGGGAGGGALEPRAARRAARRRAGRSTGHRARRRRGGGARGGGGRRRSTRSASTSTTDPTGWWCRRTRGSTRRRASRRRRACWLRAGCSRCGARAGRTALAEHLRGVLDDVEVLEVPVARGEPDVVVLGNACRADSREDCTAPWADDAAGRGFGEMFVDEHPTGIEVPAVGGGEQRPAPAARAGGGVRGERLVGAAQHVGPPVTVRTVSVAACNISLVGAAPREQHCTMMHTAR